MEAFVYRYRELPTGKWYIGYHKGTPYDGYTCSSSIVKPLINAYPDQWERKILRFGTKEEMYNLERRLLKGLNAIDNPMSYNRHNGNGHAGQGRTKGTVNRHIAGVPIPRDLVKDQIDKINTVKPKKTNNNNHGGARQGAGKKKGTKTIYGLYHIMRGFKKIGIQVDGLSLEDAKRLKVQIPNFKFTVELIDNVKTETSNNIKNNTIDELFS